VILGAFTFFVYEPTLIPGYPTINIQNVTLIDLNTLGYNPLWPYPADYPGLSGNVTILVTGYGTFALRSLLLNATGPDGHPPFLTIPIASIMLPNGTTVAYPQSAVSVVLPVQIVIRVGSALEDVNQAALEKTLTVSINGIWSIGLSIPVHLQSQTVIKWQLTTY